jgi:hypothetical protein
MMYSKQKPKTSFVMIEREMIRSKAWKKLNHYSVRAYLHIKYKFNGKNADDLSFTYEEATKIMNGHTYKKAIDQLVQYGFIDMKRSGACFGKCNIFALSERWKKYGTEAFREGKRVVVGKKWNPLKLTQK